MFTTLNFLLWAAQILLFAMFGLAGIMKSTRPIAKLGEMMGWVKDYKPTTVRFVGIVEALGALGMILPMATGILPWLTPLAAIGFVIIQLLAIPVHAKRNETGKTLPINLLLLALSIFVVWGRFGLFTP
jgi:hypothetical protein